MNTIFAFLAMCLLGYITYVFIANSMNPFQKARFWMQREKINVARVIGASIALSGLVAFAIPAPDIAAKIKACFALAILLVFLILLCLAGLQLFRWISLRKARKSLSNKENGLPKLQQARTKSSHNRAAKGKASKRSKPVTVQTVASTADHENSSPVMNTAVADTESDEIKKTDSSTSEVNLPEVAPVQVSAITADSSIEDSTNAKKDSSQRLVGEQSAHVFADSSSIINSPNPYPVSNQPALNADFGEETNLPKQSSEQTNLWQDEDSTKVLQEQDRLVNYQEPAAEASITDTTLVSTSTTSAANHGQYLYSTGITESIDTHNENSVVADDLFEDIAVESIEEVAQDESAIWPDLEGVDETQAEQINNLKGTLDQAMTDSYNIEESLRKVSALNNKESYYRSRMDESRLITENTQRAQLDSQKMELQLGERRLEDEARKRRQVEQSLEAKLRSLQEAQSRVLELEANLQERQRVFSDQTESLEKTRKMARHAATLARRAAVAQHRARTQALQERAARERLETSAKKAVHIARNAISKLAEEEKRNRPASH